MQKKRIKKRFVRFAAFMLTLLSFCLHVVPVRAADNFHVTIQKDGMLSSNGNLIFNVSNVGPGFYSAYNIDFDNFFREDVKVYVEKITVETTATTTAHFRFNFDGGELSLAGGIRDIRPNSPAVIVIPKGSSKQLKLDFKLLESAGNEYQNKEFVFTISFRIESLNPTGYPTESSDPTTTETTDPYESSDPIETTTPFESSDPFETTTPFESSDPFETTTPFESSDPFESTTPFESSDPFETTNPFESSDLFETTDPFESSDLEQNIDGGRPQTGDQSQPLLIVGILLISALYLTLLIKTRREETEHEDEI